MGTAVGMLSCKAHHVGLVAMHFGVQSTHVRLHCRVYVGVHSMGAQLQGTHAHGFCDVYVCAGHNSMTPPPPQPAQAVWHEYLTDMTAG